MDVKPVKKFKAVFGEQPHILAQAPGRVNIIGEHTDYNDGFVLPMAIEHRVNMLASPRADRTIRLFSYDFSEEVQFALDDIQYDSQHPWSNYSRGVAAIFQQAGYSLQGANLLFSGNVPIGAGLSSSAAVEVATAMALRMLNKLPIADDQIPVLCQRAENEFVQMKCGIMDQFVSTMARRGHLLFLDCRNLEYKLVPFSNSEIQIAILNTKVKRELTQSAYNERRAQCEQGVRILQQWAPHIQALRDVSWTEFQRYRSRMPEVIAKRCEHVISENQRVLEFVQILSIKDFKAHHWRKLGMLMRQSHVSLRDLYEVSCWELDVMVELAESVPGVLGARLTGAGFGGCVVALVQRQAVEALSEKIQQEYLNYTGIQPEIYISSAADGASAKMLS